MLTVADRWEGGGGKICQNLADVICERSLKPCKIAEEERRTSSRLQELNS